MRGYAGITHIADESVAAVTGESVSLIQNRGFGIADPFDVSFDPEPRLPLVFGHRKAWLIRCTVNRAKSTMSAPWRKRTVPLETAAEVGVTDEYREVYAAVLSLPPRYRAPIHLFYYEGLTTAEIAADLSLAEGTTTLLSTPEADEEKSRAWRLYRRFGFVDVLRHFHFPGDERPFGVLGRDLPLPPPDAP